jgi:hypothetical protein
MLADKYSRNQKITGAFISSMQNDALRSIEGAELFGSGAKQTIAPFHSGHGLQILGGEEQNYADVIKRIVDLTAEFDKSLKVADSVEVVVVDEVELYWVSICQR